MKRPADELLNHEADGIREFDNALPRWWLYGFYFTIAFAVVYYVNYHVLGTPLVGKASVVAEYEAEMAAGAHQPGATPGGPAAVAVALRTDAASIEAGRAIFNGTSNLCSTCHRADLGGLVGPNLTDEHWLNGCDIAQVMKNVVTGFPVRGMMPYGSGKPLTDEQVLQVVSYVFSKKGSSPANPKPVDPERDKICGQSGP